MKVTVEIEGKPSEVAALVGEIAGRRFSGEVLVKNGVSSVDDIVSMIEKASAIRPSTGGTSRGERC